MSISMICTPSVLNTRSAAVKLALPCQGNAEPHAVRHGAERIQGARPRIGIGIIRPGQHRQCREGILDREREHRDAVERSAGRYDACVRNEAEARLEPDNVVEPGGYASRTRSI